MYICSFIQYTHVARTSLADSLQQYLDKRDKTEKLLASTAEGTAEAETESEVLMVLVVLSYEYINGDFSDAAH